MTKEIIVVGANSFAGKAIMPRLINSYKKTHLISRTLPDIKPDAKIQSYVARDISSESVKQAIDSCDCGIYFASSTTPASSANSPLTELDKNLRPLLEFLELLQNKNNFTLIYTSSGGTVYGNAITGPISENQPFSPRSYYSAGKIAGESFVHAFSRQTGNNAIILRPSNFYGVGQPYKENFGIIRTIFDSIVKNKPVTIWGDGDTRRDFLYIDDFISACLLLLEKPHTDKVETYNVAAGTSISINELCDLIEKITGKTLNKIYKPIRQIDVKNVELDSTKLMKLGWSPDTNIDTGLKLMWEWIKNQ